ncbi:MAG: Thymidylate synthase, partial [uncultured Nocardioides sp.]
ARLPRPPPADPRRGRREDRPHRHRHALGLRAPDALRPDRGVPAGHDEEGAHALGLRRAAVVPARRHQRQVAPGPGHHDLGRVGRRGRRPRSGLRLPVAVLAHPRRPARRPGRAPRRGHPHQPRQPPSHRLGVERRRRRRHGAAAVPHALPVLRRTVRVGPGPAELPALPALGRHVPRRAVQHRVLRPAHPHGRPGHGPGGRGLRAHHRRRAPLPQPRRPGAAPAHPRPPPAADAAAGPRRDRDRRLRPRGHRGRGLRPAPGDQGTHRRM